MNARKNLDCCNKTVWNNTIELKVRTQKEESAPGKASILLQKTHSMKTMLKDVVDIKGYFCEVSDSNDELIYFIYKTKITPCYKMERTWLNCVPMFCRK